MCENNYQRLVRLLQPKKLNVLTQLQQMSDFCLPQNEVRLITGNCYVGSVVSLPFNVMADSTNVNDKVRIGSSFHCIGKATVVSALDILASRGVVDLGKKPTVSLQLQSALFKNLLPLILSY